MAVAGATWPGGVAVALALAGGGCRVSGGVAVAVAGSVLAGPGGVAGSGGMVALAGGFPCASTPSAVGSQAVAFSPAICAAGTIGGSAAILRVKAEEG